MVSSIVHRKDKPPAFAIIPGNPSMPPLRIVLYFRAPTVRVR